MSPFFFATFPISVGGEAFVGSATRFVPGLCRELRTSSSLAMEATLDEIMAVLSRHFRGLLNDDPTHTPKKACIFPLGFVGFSKYL